MRYQSLCSSNSSFNWFRLSGAVLRIVNALQRVVVGGVFTAVVVNEAVYHDIASYDVVFHFSILVLFAAKHHETIEVLVLSVRIPAERNGIRLRCHLQTCWYCGSNLFTNSVDRNEFPQLMVLGSTGTHSEVSIVLSASVHHLEIES